MGIEKWPTMVTADAPALASFNNCLHVAFRSNDAEASLCMTSAADGRSFGAVNRVGISMGGAPALAVFDGRLYAVMRSYGPDGVLVILSSPDGVQFDRSTFYSAIAIG